MPDDAAYRQPAQELRLHPEQLEAVDVLLAEPPIPKLDGFRSTLSEPHEGHSMRGELPKTMVSNARPQASQWYS